MQFNDLIAQIIEFFAATFTPLVQALIAFAAIFGL